ncbi:unnamed protein product [Ilex paraguariensis]|uniref:Uncharacterized protein n=1 Tax=Ilex paraguariensis TaxID=185542 RepID=A0ABC8T4V3_9AQUA
MNSSPEPRQIPPKPPDITKNFASLFRKPSVVNNSQTRPVASEINSFTFVDPFGCFNSMTMPLNSNENRRKSNVQFASVLPSTVSVSAENQNSSSRLGTQVPIDSSIDRNTQGTNLLPQPSLISHLISTSKGISMDRVLPISHISDSEKGIQTPVVISNVDLITSLITPRLGLP